MALNEWFFFVLYRHACFLFLCGVSLSYGDGVRGDYIGESAVSGEQKGGRVDCIRHRDRQLDLSN